MLAAAHHHELARAYPIVISPPCSPVRPFSSSSSAFALADGSLSLQSTPAGGRFTAPPTPHTANVDVNGRYFHAKVRGGSMILASTSSDDEDDDDEDEEGCEEMSPFSPDSTTAQVPCRALLPTPTTPSHPPFV